MSKHHITDYARVVYYLSRFMSFVQHMDGHPGCISFRDSAGFLGREEDYKSRIAEKAREVLNFVSWDESWIGTGKIAECAIKAISKSGNLVNKNQQMDFKNRLSPQHEKYRPEAERVLFDIYRNPLCEESVAFANAVAAFGAKYDTIAFLFFVKDDTRFLPISTGHFDTGFAALGIEHITSYRCSWENYRDFVDAITEIYTLMAEMLPMQGPLRLIDAHSFVWVIQEDRFKNWVPDAEQNTQIERVAERRLLDAINGSGGRRSIHYEASVRSVEVVKATRKRAGGICQYCRRPAPFIDKKGDPYLEVHHIVWLSRGGADNTDNTVALCPNCHSRMHILDIMDDVEKLKAVVRPAAEE